MDNRTGRGHRDPGRYVSEVGTDTVPVKLVQIQGVGARGPRSQAPLFLASMAIVAILAFALGGSLATPAPQASPSAAPVAAASPTLGAAAPSPDATTRPTPRPTPVVTPSPTPKPWAWAREDLPGDPLKPTGIWMLGDQLLIPEVSWDGGSQGYAAAVARRSPQDGWDLAPMGSAVNWLSTATLVDGRIWVVARLGGVSQSEVTWEIASTRDGAEWTSLGPIKGLDQLDGMLFLQRLDDTWVAGALYATPGPCCTGGEYGMHIVWSRDGVHWTLADVPALELPMQYGYAALYRDSIVVVAAVGAEERGAPVVLRSNDGMAWRLLDGHGLEIGDEPTGLACGVRRCLVTSYRPFCECPDDGPTAHVLTGSRWSVVELEVPGVSAEGEGPRAVTAVGHGFIAVDGNTGNAVVSPDGESWGVFDVMPGAGGGPMAGLTIHGDTILAVRISLDDGTPSTLWRGSLAALGL